MLSLPGLVSLEAISVNCFLVVSPEGVLEKSWLVSGVIYLWGTHDKTTVAGLISQTNSLWGVAKEDPYWTCLDLIFSSLQTILSIE